MNVKNYPAVPNDLRDPLGSSNLSIVVILNTAIMPKNRINRSIPVVNKPIRIGIEKNPTQS